MLYATAAVLTSARQALAGPKQAWSLDFVVETLTQDIQDSAACPVVQDLVTRHSELLYESYEVRGVRSVDNT